MDLPVASDSPSFEVSIVLGPSKQSEPVVTRPAVHSDVPKVVYHHNADYYFNSIIFLVGNELFNVPRHKFESESVIFRSMFDLPSGNATPDGLSDEQPLRLDGIDGVDFCNLLKYLYPKGISTPVLLTLDQWLAVLKLSTLWEMENIRKDAIENIPALVDDPARWLGLAIDFDVEVWFVPAMNKLVQRAEPISMADLLHIGIECALKIAAIREVCHSNHARGYGSSILPQAVRGAVTYDCKDRIRQEFKEYLTTPLLLADKVITASGVNEAVEPEISSEPFRATPSKMSGLKKKKKQRNGVSASDSSMLNVAIRNAWTAGHFLNTHPD
ncbi:hypothetical protein AB1N83_011241 [Pleurotus pulmonarius]